jgi:hypothetical protein
VLRALNGAGIGTVLGGLLGGLLGVVASLVVTLIGMAMGNFSGSTLSNSLHWATLCGALGVIPGVPAGFLLGPAIIIRNHRARVLVGAVFGFAAGALYVWAWIAALRDQWILIAATVISGVLGGVILTLIQGAIRRRWNWWTRWEDHDLSSSAVTEAGGNVTA